MSLKLIINNDLSQLETDNEELLKVMKHEEDFVQNLYSTFENDPMVRASGIMSQKPSNPVSAKTVDKFVQETRGPVTEQVA